MSNGNGRPFGRHLLIVGLGTLSATIVISLITETLVRQMAQIWLALSLLVLIVFVGVLFDIIGTAAAAAREAPLHAKAAKKVFGARQSVYLVKNRDKVANFTQDVIGDITGIIAGALGITLMFQVAVLRPGIDALVFNVLITAMIASAIITGKAYGKRVAVEKAEGIIFLVGKILAGAEKLCFWRARPGNRSNKFR